MTQRIGMITVMVLVAAALSGCIYVGGTRHYHDRDDEDYYNNDRYDTSRYDTDRYRGDRYDSNYYQDEYRGRQANE